MCQARFNPPSGADRREYASPHARFPEEDVTDLTAIIRATGDVKVLRSRSNTEEVRPCTHGLAKSLAEVFTQLKVVVGSVHPSGQTHRVVDAIR